MINEIFMFVMGMFLSAWTYLTLKMYNGNYQHFNLYFVAIVFLWTGIIEYNKYKDTYKYKFNRDERRYKSK